MRILSVKAENLLSIDKLELSFEDSGLVLIEGWNYDDDRATGAGKTAIFNILSFALYGKLPRKITASEILRRGAKSGFVEITLVVKDDVYRVRRERPKAESYIKNDIPVTMTQDEFEAAIKLSYDQFLIAMYTPQGSGDRFLSLNDTAKKDFLLQLMNLEQFLTGKKNADKIIHDLEGKLAEDRLQVEKAAAKIEVYSEQIIDTHLVIEEIALLTQTIDSLSNELKVLSELTRPDTSKYDKLESDIAQKLADLNTMRYKRNQEFSRFKELSSQVCEFSPPKHNALCPHCDGQLVATGDKVTAVGDVKTLRSHHDQAMDVLKQHMLEIKQLIDSYDTELCKEQSIKDFLIKTKEARTKEYKSYDLAKSRADSLRQTIAQDSMQVKALQAKLASIEDAKQKVSVLKEYIQQIEKKTESYQVDINLYKTIASICSATGVPAYIMDSAVELFNDKIARYIGFIWPTASYQLNTYRENKSGDVTSKFSESLTIDGTPCSIGSLSGGEFRAFSLAGDFALVYVLIEQFGLTVNPVLMDEPFEGLDAKGREVVIGLLEKLSDDRQILVIDHASEAKVMFSKIIRVEKQQGITHIAVS
jgi:DNA repair exonuclease SbcCD ATPase subunit